MRELARREPTFALHVHVAVPDEHAAVRALDGLREELPLLLALSANSPYWQGRDSGLASARIPVFQAFPRTGTPRAFGTYEAYVEAVDVLIRCDAIPSRRSWWDARLQPRLGTIEVRIMDAQTRVRDTAALAALVQCLVRREALERAEDREPVAARGARGEPLPRRPRRHGRGVRRPRGRPLRAVADRLAETLRSCAPHAELLRCERELASVSALAERSGALRQRALAAAPEGLPGVLRAMSGDFVSPLAEPAVARLEIRSSAARSRWSRRRWPGSRTPSRRRGRGRRS